MKLRNKKTGDVFDFDSITDLCFGSKIQLQATNMHNKPIYIFNSLAELNEEWEDYKEPVKPYWFINDLDGEPMKCDWRNCGKQNFTRWGEHRKRIGNYFDTREEAEKAVEKLKAFKRLQDLGFRFEGIRFRDKHSYIEWKLKPKNELTDDETGKLIENLYKVFGGKDESNQ